LSLSLSRFIPAAVRESEEEEAERVPAVSLPREVIETGRGSEGGRAEGCQEGGGKGKEEEE